MPSFCLLSDPRTYRPCPTDMLKDAEFRTHWLAHFKKHFEFVMQLAVDVYGEEARERTEKCKADFIGIISELERTPDMYGELNLLVLDVVRQQKLLAWDLPDPFIHVKERENEAMLAHYGRVVAELDSHTQKRDALLMAVEGVFAGNIFDLGIMATAQRFSTGSVDFVKIRNEVAGNRPWLVDQFDTFAEKYLSGKGYKKAVLFVDNAGSDCVLGMIPLARLLALGQTRVILAANDLPALNDVTSPELGVLLERIGAIDPLLNRLVRDGMIQTINSGGIAPLLDLRHVSAELNEVAADADLVMLEGMGRALESNFDAMFKVDSVKFCMIKDQMIAQREGGKIYDTVFRFDGAH